MVPFGSLKRAKRLAREEFGSPPPTKVEKDKKKYSRKVKHKEKL